MCKPVLYRSLLEMLLWKQWNTLAFSFLKPNERSKKATAKGVVGFLTQSFPALFSHFIAP
jgi:hypothetical protein